MVTFDPNNNPSALSAPVISISTTCETNNSLGKSNLAVRGRNLCLTYGSGPKAAYVLNNLSMSVPAGGIYGLLGPSGCGKTSLLKIICGLQRADTGTVRIFGCKPGERGSGVPGPGIGYMPQDVALLPDLTVEEMLSYFGNLYYLPAPVIRKQINDLVSLLEIPDKKRIIEAMSGGQQRRLSLACTIIHKPRLVILDEPTVGVDPLLCSRIWELLYGLAREESMTIIVTTHYIEECRRAKMVGFMRKGEILEEDEPEAMIKRFSAENLEDVFYKICLAQKRRNTLIAAPLVNRKAVQRKSLSAVVMDDSHLDKVEPYKSPQDSRPIYSAFWPTWTLYKRYLLQVKRQPIFLILLFLFPITSLGFLYICVGHTPKDLPVGWVVEEEAEYGSLHARPEDFDEAFNSYLIPYYPDLLKSHINSQIINLIPYNSLDSGLADVRRLKLDGVIHMTKGFSEAFHERLNYLSAKDIDDDTVKRGTINIYGDLSDAFAMTTIELCLQLSLLEVMNETAPTANLPYHSRSLPFQIGKPIYGNLGDKNNFGLQDYAAPGFMVVVLYGCSLGLSALSLAAEVADKMFDRNYSTGITIGQLLIAQVAARFTYLAINCVLVHVITIFVFGVTNHGSFGLGIALLLLQTLVGQVNGMVFAAVFPAIEHLAFVALGSLLYMLFISGVFWPVESLPYYFRYLSISLPFTEPAKALRAIMLKQGAPFHPLIWPGFAVSAFWFFALLALSYLIFSIKFKRT
ncbi:ABC transporter G family member 20-like [Panonychus citri]|uniref:ABC transporter G family member 20-like n=1 Tax=Panonychus citri TaxID=50023 RepID=UPI0023078CCF|nr:ABC transporter G family member 20-like [Panonychus citri]